MNLISEILCKKTVLGRPVINEVIFIAACNPYRVMKGTKEEEDIGLKNKDHKIRSLVYTVNPLPHSLLNFVFDFGCLTKENEKRYIQAMLKKTFDDILQSEEEKFDDILQSSRSSNWNTSPNTAATLALLISSIKRRKSSL